MSNPPKVDFDLPPTQEVIFKEKAHAGLLAGADILASAVASTMGPSGHSVIIDNIHGSPSITKDGVTVARSINLKDRLQSVGAELLKEVAAKTNDIAGDGPQPTYAKVLTPHGWTTMGNLRVGDTICGTNGTVQSVLGVYSKGIKDIYKVTLADGNTGTRFVECSEEHLWDIKTLRGTPRLITTKEMLNSGIERNINPGDPHTSAGKYFISTTSVEFLCKQKLPIDPYLLGVLLGDGRLSRKHEIEISVALNQDFILEKLVLPKSCKLRKRHYANKKHYIRAMITGGVRKNMPRAGQKSIIKKALKNLDLLGTNSHTKFIPKQYLFSTIKNRQKLLQGLLDTDGYKNNRGLFEYSTISKQLCLDFVELCRSLGKPINCRKVIRKRSAGSHNSKNIYKISELKGNKYGLKIKAIEKLNRQTEMMCIKVSNADHLYITNDYVPTHNTTTATVLAHALLQEGVKQIATGRSAIYLKKGMDIATEEVIRFLRENAIPVGSRDNIVNVGTISANGDKEVGELIAKAIEKVGKDGIITVEPAKSVQTTLEVVEGMQLPNGYISPFFITDAEKSICELKNPYILCTSNKISSLSEIMSVLEKTARSDRPLLVIADGVEGDALHTLIVNKMKGILKVCAVKAPSYGEHRANILDDLSKVIGGEVFGATSQISLKKAGIEHLGEAKKVVISRTSCTIVGDPENKERRELVKERVQSLRTSLAEDKTLDDLRVSKFRERLAKLSGGIAVIKVGGSTEVEILEKKDRVEDAVNATLAATKEGIVPGGGTALFYASQALRARVKTGTWPIMEKGWVSGANGEDVLAGVKIIINVCEYPIKTIVRNTGQSPDVVINALETNNKIAPEFCVGYNAASGVYTNLITDGVIDPVRVTRYCIENATSVIGLVLACNCVIIDQE